MQPAGQSGAVGARQLLPGSAAAARARRHHLAEPLPRPARPGARSLLSFPWPQVRGGNRTETRRASGGCYRDLRPAGEADSSIRRPRKHERCVSSSHGSRSCSGREKKSPPKKVLSLSPRQGLCPAASARLRGAAPPPAPRPPGLRRAAAQLPAAPASRAPLLGLAPSIIHAPQRRQRVRTGLAPSAFKPAPAGKRQPPSQPVCSWSGQGAAW